MSDHNEHHDHEEHLEVYPDSGITETAKPIAVWLWVTYVAGLVFFHAFINDQFWNQKEDLPLFGSGWQVGYGDTESFPIVMEGEKSPRRSLASEHVLGLPTVNSRVAGQIDAGPVYNPNESHIYTGNYGGRR